MEKALEEETAGNSNWPLGNGPKACAFSLGLGGAECWGWESLEDLGLLLPTTQQSATT